MIFFISVLMFIINFVNIVLLYLFNSLVHYSIGHLTVCEGQSVPDVDKPVGLCGQLTVFEGHSVPILIELFLLLLQMFIIVSVQLKHSSRGI